MYFDTHAHLDDARFDGDREALLERMRAEGIDPCMTVGANMEMNEKAVALAQRYPGYLYAAVGIHPNDAPELTEEALGRLRAWAKLPCVKAWGEALRPHLKHFGINVSTVCPGFVRSRITDKNTCPMPFFMEADAAARLIAARVEKNVGLIAFPWPMRFAVWLGSILPNCISDFIYGRLPYKV